MDNPRFFTLNADIEVEYDYDPGEPQTYTDPGYGPSVSFNNISISGYAFPLAGIPEDFLDFLEEQIIEKVQAEDAEDFSDEPDHYDEDYDDFDQDDQGEKT